MDRMIDDGLSGMVPAALKVRQQRIVIDRIEVMADIGFHDFEIGAPQRLLVSIELWIDPPTAAGRRRSRARVGL